MNQKSNKEEPVQPQNVPEEKTKRVLEFLNTARTAAEIAGTIEIPGERDVGMWLAQKILDRRQELGSFSNLTEVADISQVGPKRFTRIILLIPIVSLMRCVQKIRIKFSLT